MKTMPSQTVHIIGGGLAGQRGGVAARARRRARRAARDAAGARHRGACHRQRLAELVCSNSFRSDDAENNAVGLLHEEMRRCGSLDHARRRRARVPAGGALAVDRRRLLRGGRRRRCSPSRWSSSGARRSPGCRPTSGTASSSPPAPSPRRRWPAAIRALTRRGRRSPSSMPSRRSSIARAIDMEKAWLQSRYDKGDGADYINCPLDKRRSTRPSSPRCSPATRPNSRNGRRTRPISRAACRSR